MRRLLLQSTDRRLTLRRDRRKDLLCLSAVGSAAALLLGLCFLRIPHGWPVPTGSHAPLLAIGLLFCAAFGWRLSLNLRRQDWVVDRETQQITLNERPVESLGELESVCLDRSYYHHTDSSVLYLRTRSRVLLEIARDGLFGVGLPEMREVADALSDYGGLNLVTPDGFRPGHAGRRRRLRKTTLTLRRQVRRTRASFGLRAGYKGRR